MQPVAEQVEAQRRQEDRDAREGGWPGAEQEVAAALTYSASFSTSVGARRVRAKIGMYTTPIATPVLTAPGPRTAMMPIASRMIGKANSTSIRRIASRSGQPPR